MMKYEISTPVFVLDASHHGALGVTRSLGRLGVEVYNVAPLRSRPAFSSRYSRQNIVWDLNQADSEQTAQFLLSLGKRLSRPALLIAVSDRAAMFLADHNDLLRSQFRFPEQRPQVVRSLCNKKSMQRLAKSLEIPIAASAFPASRAEVLHFLDAARFPIIVKAIKDAHHDEAQHYNRAILYNRCELLALYDRWENPEHPNFMLQEYIPGQEDASWMFNGYFNQDSDCLVSFTGRKVRQFPAYAGVTGLGVCAKNEFLHNTSQHFMKAVHYRGVVDIEYRFDARDGKYKLLDVNPRIGAEFRLFVDDLGYDVARALYLDMTGQPVHAGRLREGRKWIVEDLDLASSLRYYSDGRMSFKDWISSLRGIEECALFTLDDPLPAGARAIQDFRAWLVRLLGSLKSPSTDCTSRCVDKFTPREPAVTDAIPQGESRSIKREFDLYYEDTEPSVENLIQNPPVRYTRESQ
jgi:D-aspartate ligase